MVYFAYAFVGVLMLSPLVFWVYGKYFSCKAIDEMAKQLPEAVNKEVCSRLWVEYEVGRPGLFGWKMGFWTKPFHDEPFEPHEDIYNEEKLVTFTDGQFTTH